MFEGTTLRVTVAYRPYGEFYDFYSDSPEYFGLTPVIWPHMTDSNYTNKKRTKISGSLRNPTTIYIPIFWRPR
jgi:hypothetical protein